MPTRVPDTGGRVWEEGQLTQTLVSGLCVCLPRSSAPCSQVLSIMLLAPHCTLGMQDTWTGKKHGVREGVVTTVLCSDCPLFSWSLLFDVLSFLGHLLPGRKLSSRLPLLLTSPHLSGFFSQPPWHISVNSLENIIRDCIKGWASSLNFDLPLVFFSLSFSLTGIYALFILS